MKYALITGASGGIGAATARAFAQAGYGVAIHAHRSVDKLHALAGYLLEKETITGEEFMEILNR